MNANLQVIDRIGKAFARERKARQWPVWQPVPVPARAREFKCVCCGRSRAAGERREPESEVCVHCVRAAGFQN